MAIQKISAQPSFQGKPEFIRRATGSCRITNMIKPEDGDGITSEAQGLFARIKSALKSLPDEGDRR